jgi:phosphoenolpyruvate---glycerone phosphotransferase subunit DhaL
MTTELDNTQLAAAMARVAAALKANQQMITELDQAVGDGDLGVTAVKLAETLEAAAGKVGVVDVGKWFAETGMALNRAAPSTMGTLTATALMQAGKAAIGKEKLAVADLPLLLNAATTGIETRGKARVGDKTLLDVLRPASDAFAAALAAGQPLAAAGAVMLAAARDGRDRVTPLRNKVGRASWLGERTEGKMDPGCAFAVVVLAAMVGA